MGNQSMDAMSQSSDEEVKHEEERVLTDVVPGIGRVGADRLAAVHIVTLGDLEEVFINYEASSSHTFSKYLVKEFGFNSLNASKATSYLQKRCSPSITSIPGIGAKIGEKLENGGYSTVYDMEVKFRELGGDQDAFNDEFLDDYFLGRTQFANKAFAYLSLPRPGFSDEFDFKEDYSELVTTVPGIGEQEAKLLARVKIHTTGGLLAKWFGLDQNESAFLTFLTKKARMSPSQAKKAASAISQKVKGADLHVDEGRYLEVKKEVSLDLSEVTEALDALAVSVATTRLSQASSLKAAGLLSGPMSKRPCSLPAIGEGSAINSETTTSELVGQYFAHGRDPVRFKEYLEEEFPATAKNLPTTKIKCSTLISEAIDAKVKRSSFE